MKKIVIIGGGSGTSTILQGLKKKQLFINVIVTVSDNGGSTGVLRDKYNIPALGDIRKVISTLSSEKIKKILEHRCLLKNENIKHPIGNILMISNYKKTNNLQLTINNLRKLFDIKHKIIPISEDNLTLMAKLENDEIIIGQKEIMKSYKNKKEIFYKEEFNINKEAIESIRQSSLIILSMGSLYTSVIPNLLSNEIVKSLKNKTIIYVANPFIEPGETDGFTLSDHIKELEKYINRKIDIIIANNNYLNINNRENKLKEYVKVDYNNLINYQIYSCDLIKSKNNNITYDYDKVADIIEKI